MKGYTTVSMLGVGALESGEVLRLCEIASILGEVSLKQLVRKRDLTNQMEILECLAER